MFAPDPRYSVQFAPERREYNLIIRELTKFDQGVYECQVSSREKLTRFVMLNVIGMPIESIKLCWMLIQFKYFWSLLLQNINTNNTNSSLFSNYL